QCFEETTAAEKDLSLMDIVRLTGYDKSTAQRFTHTLQTVGYLSKNPNTKRYSLSVKAMELAFNFLRNDSFIEIANPHLIELCRITDQRVSLSLFDDTGIVYVMRHQTKPDYYYSSLAGRRLLACCNAGGRAILAKLDEAKVLDILSRSEVIPYTTKTITDKAKILQEIKKIEQKGYGLSVEQVTYGELGLGAAITDKAGYPFAALHIIGSLADQTSEVFEGKYAPLILETVQRISGR
ncbi:MAG TPA: IclR family transcriptional regulator, partial [Pseudomonadales bacterium]|nr:IclR family transcriptional regulator [Pseudomonadales bacterium]